MKKAELLKTVQEALATEQAECIVLMLHMPGGDVDVVQSTNLEAKAKYIDIAFDDDLVCIENPCIFVENFGIAYQDSLKDFGAALMNLKEGKRVARIGWNGKNQYIQLATGISYKTASGGIVNCEHEAIGNKAIAFVGTSGVQMGWLASQSDMLADDWYVVAD